MKKYELYFINEDNKKKRIAEIIEEDNPLESRTVFNIINNFLSKFFNVKHHYTRCYKDNNIWTFDVGFWDKFFKLKEIKSYKIKKNPSFKIFF